VIVTVFIFGLYFYVVDAAIGGALEWVLSHGAK
jgi:preprotein translocase subunit SecE